MSFSGTTQKCKACDKTVHFVEMVSADGVAYHNTCFRCSNCNGKLSISNYHMLEGDLYCKPHFEQRLKETGIVPKLRSNSAGKADMLNKVPSKLSGMFSGTQEKCDVCKKTVYPLEKVTVEGKFYHRTCFRCAHGGCNLTPSSYAALDGIVYCKPHFSQLFKEKGSYTTLNKSSSMKNDDINPQEIPADGETEDHKPAEEEEAKPQEET